MTTDMEITWLTDDTIRVQAVLKDFDGSLLTPSSQEVIIYNPLGVAQGTFGSPTLDGTGTYRIDYGIQSDGQKGNWKVSWKALAGTYPAREVKYFEVAEG